MFRQVYTNGLAFLIGGLVGVATMWFVAPKTGEENRRMLTDGLNEAKNKANQAIEDTQIKIRQLSSIGQQVVDESKSSLERGAEKAKTVAQSF